MSPNLINILLVDDDRDLLELSKIFLEMENPSFRITTVNSAQEAIQILGTHPFDVIVSDYQMPNLNGLEFLKILRQEHQSETPFIIFTGRGREEVAIQALNLGVNRYIQKGGEPKSQFGILAKAIIDEAILKRTATQLIESGKLFESIFNNSTDGLALIHLSSGSFYIANKKFYKFTGTNSYELNKLKLTDILLDKDFDVQNFYQRISSKKPIILQNMPIKNCLTNETTNVDFSGNFLNFEGEQYLMATFRDISVLKFLDETLAEYAKAQEKYGEIKEKQELINTLLRHDLRNKAQIIQNSLYILQNLTKDATQKTTAQKAITASKQISQLLEKISFLDQIRYEENLKQINLTQEIQSVVRKYEQQAEEYNISILFSEERDFFVKGGNLLTEVFSILIENALYHSQASRIEIFFENHTNRVSVNIKDNGIGLPALIQETIFDWGVRGESSSGLGIGLFLAKKIVLNYGGEILVNSTTNGCTFKTFLNI